MAVDENKLSKEEKDYLKGRARPLSKKTVKLTKKAGHEWKNFGLPDGDIEIESGICPCTVCTKDKKHGQTMLSCYEEDHLCCSSVCT